MGKNEPNFTPAKNWQRLKFSVDGTPVPQGSMRIYNGHIVHNKAQELAAWRAQVAVAAKLSGCKPLDGPIIITMNFRVARPKTVKRDHPTVAPDLDKYIRNVNDALTGICFYDDAQVVEIHSNKRYSDTPGVTIVIEQMF